MLRRAFNFACLVSAALLGFTLVLSAASSDFDTPDYHLSLSDGFHIGLLRFGRDSLGRIAFYNNAEYGPYRGSLLFLEEPPPMPRRVDFRCRYGICYCDYLWEDGVALWTLMVSLWYPVLLFGVLPLIWGWQNQGAIIRQIRTLCATKRSEHAASNDDSSGIGRMCGKESKNLRTCRSSFFVNPQFKVGARRPGCVSRQS